MNHMALLRPWQFWQQLCLAGLKLIDIDERIHVFR